MGIARSEARTPLFGLQFRLVCWGQQLIRLKRGSARGFALALVLWVVAGLSVIAAAVSQYANKANTAASAFSDRASAELAFSRARAELLYTLSSSGLSIKGRRVGAKMLRVDDLAYRTGDGEFVSIQDARGLLNLNSLRFDDGRLLLVGCGVPESDVPSLLDALNDYVDADDLKSINGAEAREYRAAGLPPPPNRPLLSLEELWQVLGWSKHKTSWFARGCENWVAVTNEFGFNFTTAPSTVLRAKGYAAAVADAMVAERNATEGSVSTLANNVSSFSLEVNPFGSNAVARPGNTYRVRHWHENGASVQYWVVLPSIRTEPPWIILDHTWAWLPTHARRRTQQEFPKRTPTDATEDSLTPPTSNPFG